MRNIRLILEYDGSRYNGWQRQSGKKSTVQGRIELVLEKMAGEKTELIGAGRTDADVHALGQVANFHIRDKKLSVAGIREYLDKYLPEDISLAGIEEVPEDFHARYHAKGKEYRYQIWNSERKNIFERAYYYHIRKPLDIFFMEKAKALFIGEHDFRNFCAGISKNKSSVRKIENIAIEKSGEKVILTFIGDGFLHKMVRIITGTLIQVGLCEIELSDISAMFESESRAGSGFTAPAHALFLVKVFY